MKYTKPYGTTTITSKGQMAIPLGVRRRLGIRRGQPISVGIVGGDLCFTLLPRSKSPTHRSRTGKEETSL